jgi:hypothetical protein
MLRICSFHTSHVGYKMGFNSVGVLISQQKCSILGWKQEHFKKFKGPGVGVACAAPNMHGLVF